MRSFNTSRNSGLRGFTLVEILAAITVLAILLVVFTQVIGMISDTWKKGKARIDNFAQARVALGLIDRDIQSMVLRRDVGAFVDATLDGSGKSKPACAFYTRMSGAETSRDRRLSLVQYVIADAATHPRLIRRDYGLDYGSASSPRTMGLNEMAMLPDLNLAQPQDIAEGIIGFEYQFLDGNGLFQRAFRYDHDEPGALTNTRAITISLVVMDADSFRMAETTGKLAVLLTALQGSPAAGQSQADYWRAQMAKPDFMSSLPQPIRGSLRIFERSIALPLDTVGS